MKATDLRPGYGVKMDGKLFVITNFDHRTPGNLRAFIQIKIRNVLTGQILEKRLASNDDLEVIDIDRRPMEFLYAEGKDGVFMDTENYDQITIGASTLGETLLYLRPNATCVVMLHDGRPIQVELPASVELTVKDCPPGVRNGTATNVQKDAELETGLKARVPEFISIGETVRISTSDGSYQSRA
ncbi:MAG: elongation factor P [Phycisphaerales bacterium]